jgi:two-component system response regulator YesN
LNLSSSYVSRVFSKEENLSIRQVLSSIRMREAKKLLIETELSIGDVSRLTGFEYPQYFSKKFKDEVGVTPKKYLEKMILRVGQSSK